MLLREWWVAEDSGREGYFLVSLKNVLWWIPGVLTEN